MWENNPSIFWVLLILPRSTAKFESQKNFKMKRAGVYKPPKETMTMEGCILKLFILCSGAATIAIFVGGAELGYHFKGRVFQYFRCLVRRSQKLWVSLWLRQKFIVWVM